MKINGFRLHRAAWPALGAAILFGASTPFAKQLLGDGLATSSPFLLAGLLYLGSGIGLTLLRLLRDKGWQATGLPKHEWPWLLGAIAFGGVLGPVLLMVGLAHTTAATASLFLNLESVLTAVLAWPTGEAAGSGFGTLALAGAGLAWAIDNNLTRKVSASDALFIAGSKGLVAGCVNTGLGLALGAAWPSSGLLASALSIGFLGYGLSLVLFVLALRSLGAARTGAYFSTAPFVGVALSMAVFAEPTSAAFLLAAALMASGVWLHLTERHAHDHEHTAFSHGHRHRHDAHHQHTHDFEWDGQEPHTHEHQHANLKHHHAHFPDFHHQHSHS